MVQGRQQIGPLLHIIQRQLDCHQLGREAIQATLACTPTRSVVCSVVSSGMPLACMRF